MSHLDRDGAEHLAKRIHEFWKARGYDVRTFTVEGGFSAVCRTIRHDVRSDMKNGWPVRQNVQATRYEAMTMSDTRRLTMRDLMTRGASFPLPSEAVVHKSSTG